MNNDLLTHLANLKTTLATVEKEARICSKLLDYLEGQAYEDRNMLVLLAGALAKQAGLRVGWRIDPDEPDWPVLFIELPTGQVSWHLPEINSNFFNHYDVSWDGHTTEEKTNRIKKFLGET